MLSRFVIGEGNGNPLQYSCLENPMDRGAWWAAIHGVVKSRARLSGFIFHFHALEGNANPLQRSCLENPRDRGAWWAAVYGVAQSRTLLKQLSSSSSRFVIVFLPRSTHLLISCLQSSFAVILKPKKIKSALHKPKCEWFLLFWRCKVSTWTIQSQQWGFLGDTSSKV